MALPKRKKSKSKRDKRRTHWVATAPTVATCPQCGESKLPHRACPSCGYYRGRAVVAAKS